MILFGRLIHVCFPAALDPARKPHVHGHFKVSRAEVPKDKENASMSASFLFLIPFFLYFSFFKLYLSV